MTESRAGAPGEHPSRAWTTVLNPGAAEPRDPERFAEAMRHPSFPLASCYDPAWVYRNLMGPNCLWLAEDLVRHMTLAPGARVLDLGCGAALTSIFLAREHGVEVWAADLWIDPAQNLARAAEAGVADRLFPIRIEAHGLPFAPAFFDAVVSVDAYHYFGTDLRYLSYLAQFVKPGGTIGIAVPANARDPDDGPELLPSAAVAELGADWFTFRSPAWWRRHCSRTRGVAVEEAAMVEGGRALWCLWLEAHEAFTGEQAADTADGRLLFSPEGATLGFCRVVARRGDEATLEFGPGEFATRIA